jgi:hypothetical protein
LAALTYAGTDEIEDVATAQWLAECLWRQGIHDLGRTLTGLAAALSVIRAGPGWLDRDFDVHIVGWQWTRNGRGRPLAAGLSKAPGSPLVRVEYLPRYWHWDRGQRRADGRRGFRFNVTAAPDTLITRDQLQRVVNRLPDLPPDAAELVLADAVHHAGPDAVSIRIDPPQIGRVRIRHLVASATDRWDAYSPALSPWLVTGAECAEPAFMGAPSEKTLGIYRVLLETPVRVTANFRK